MVCVLVTPSGHCISIKNNTTNVVIENNEIGPCGKKGIDITTSHYINIRNNSIHDIQNEAVMKCGPQKLVISVLPIIMLKMFHAGRAVVMGVIL